MRLGRHHGVMKVLQRLNKEKEKKRLNFKTSPPYDLKHLINWSNNVLCNCNETKIREKLRNSLKSCFPVDGYRKGRAIGFNEKRVKKVKTLLGE